MVIMKRIVLILTLAIIVSGCSKEESTVPVSVQIIGSWSLSGYIPATKSIMIGNQSVTVAITFTTDNKFQMTQKVGNEAYEELFEGTYLIEDNILSGAYSDNSSWGESYIVDFKDTNTLIMQSSKNSDIFTYSRTN